MISKAEFGVLKNSLGHYPSLRYHVVLANEATGSLFVFGAKEVENLWHVT